MWEVTGAEGVCEDVVDGDLRVRGRGGGGALESLGIGAGEIWGMVG